MRRATPFTIAIALLVACALALSACGGGDARLLPGETAREIDANLTTVQRLAAEGDCVGAESAVEEVGEQIDGLQGVDPKLKRALEKGAVRLEEVIAKCEEVEVESTTPEADEAEEEAREAEEAEREAPEGREEGRDGRGGEGGKSEPSPERSERGEERSGGREGAEGGGEQPPSGGGANEEETQSGGVGPGTAVGGGE